MRMQTRLGKRPVSVKRQGNIQYSTKLNQNCCSSFASLNRFDALISLQPTHQQELTKDDADN